MTRVCWPPNLLPYAPLFGSKAAKAPVRANVRVPELKSPVLDDTDDRVRAVLANTPPATDRLIEPYFRTNKALFDTNTEVFHEALVQRVGVLVRLAELKAQEARLNRDTVTGFVKTALDTIFCPKLPWLDPFLTVNDQTILANIADIERHQGRERELYLQRYRRALPKRDQLLDLTARGTPFVDSTDYYLHAFRVFHPMVKRPGSQPNGEPKATTTEKKAEAIPLGTSVTHKAFLLYMEKSPQVMEPFVKRLGEKSAEAVTEEVARLKTLQATHPRDWPLCWKMTGHKTIELLRKAEIAFYDVSGRAAQRKVAAPNLATYVQSGAQWPYHLTAAYVKQRIDNDLLLSRLVLFLNPERRTVIAQLPAMIAAPQPLEQKQQERYRTTLRASVRQLQDFVDIVTPRYSQPHELSALVTGPLPDFIRQVTPILVARSEKAPYSVIPDLVIPADTVLPPIWQEVTQWDRYPHLTGLQKRILFHRLVTGLRVAPLTERLNDELGLKSKPLTEKGVQTVLEKFYKKVPPSIEPLLRTEPPRK